MGAGRPEAKIDWNQVDQLLEAGCLTTEIAAYLGICRDTLYKRCQHDKKIEFSAYSQEKKARGESLLRAKQFQVAMEGDKTMLVWLGKNRIGQADKKDMNVNNNLSDFKHWVGTQQDEDVGKNNGK